MDIYIQSCGKEETQDYRWVKVYVNSTWLNNLERQEPPILKLSQFYEADTPAVILFRNNQELILLLYWIKTKERSAQYGRPVYNSIVLVSQKHEDDLLLQMLASEALQDWKLFSQRLDGFVQWGDNEHGFQVEKQHFSKYIDLVKNEARSQTLEESDKTKKLNQDVLNVDSKSPQKQKIFQETKQKWIKKLAEELKTKQLPKGNGALVVVAENVSENILQDVKWWGISDRVQSGSSSKRKKKDLKILIILVFLIIGLGLIILAIVSQHPKNPTPEPTSQPTIIKPSPTSTTSPEPEIKPSPTPTTSSEPEIQPDSNPESQSSTETPTQSDSSNPEIPKTSSVQEEQLDRENNSST